MIFRFLITALVLCSFCFHYVKWRKSRSRIAGNEVIFLPLILASIVAFPGNDILCAMRVSVLSVIFGVHVFWSSLFKKGRKGEVPLFCYAAGIILIYNSAVLVAGVGESVHLKGYLFIEVFMLAVFYCHSFFYRGTNANLKSSISINKLLEQVVVTSPFIILSGIVMGVVYCGVESRIFACVAIGVQSVLLLGYLHYERPLCMEYRQLDEIYLVRRRGYSVLGDGVDGQLLEDEGEGIVSDAIIEDSKIIASLMELFESERIYMNVDVKIANVALMIGTNKTYLSRALNSRLSKNFCQFVNYYRVREVCRMYLQDSKSSMKVLAEMCGFSSNSNFSIVFKYNTGFTPGDWCRMIKMKLENNESICVDDYLL